MPGACAKGILARNAISIVPMIAPIAVKMYAAPKVRPLPPTFSNIPALTMRMYTIVMKVVSPASISVLKEDFIFVMPK